jgi:hypothetical protein
MIVLLVLIFTGPLLFYLLWPSDESRIRKLFKEGAAAIQARKVDDVMAKVSFNYTDEHGLSYLYLKEGTTRLFTRMDAIEVDYAVKSIAIKDEKATVDIEVRVIAGHGQERGYMAGDASRPLPMKFYLEKERVKWLVVRTEGLPVWY